MIQQKQVVIKGLLVNYCTNAKVGADQPLVFLHGWRGSAKTFQSVLDRLDARQIGFYALDLPGFGASETPQPAFDLDDYTSVVINFLENLNTKVILVGHSFGGRIAIKLATKRPDLVSQLVLVDAAGFKDQSAGVKIKRLLAVLARPLFGFKFMRPLRAKIYSAIGADDYISTQELTATFVKIINEDLSEYLPRILAPTLIVWGQNDQETPVSFAERMHQSINGSRLVIFENSGHFPFLDEPERFVELIVDRLTQGAPLH